MARPRLPDRGGRHHYLFFGTEQLGGHCVLAADAGGLLEGGQPGKLRAAGLDSFEKEPFAAPHPLQDVSNAILSPHIGGVTADAYIAMGTGAASNVLAVLNEQTVAG